jgi:hypothetical protein
MRPAVWGMPNLMLGGPLFQICPSMADHGTHGIQILRDVHFQIAPDVWYSFPTSVPIKLRNSWGQIDPGFLWKLDTPKSIWISSLFTTIYPVKMTQFGVHPSCTAQALCPAVPLLDRGRLVSFRCWKWAGLDKMDNWCWMLHIMCTYISIVILYIYMLAPPEIHNHVYIYIDSC